MQSFKRDICRSFYPPKDLRKQLAVPSGQFDSRLNYCSTNKPKFDYWFCCGNPPYWNQIFYLLCGWDGREGWLVGGDKLLSLIFFWFNYVNMLDVLTRYMAVQIVNTYFTGLKIVFEVDEEGAPFPNLQNRCYHLNPPPTPLEHFFTIKREGGIRVISRF